MPCPRCRIPTSSASWTPAGRKALPTSSRSWWMGKRSVLSWTPGSCRSERRSMSGFRSRRDWRRLTRDLNPDIKPANILISRSGVVRIADFGLAKLQGPFGPDSDGESTAAAEQSASTEEGTFLGTIGYMAPEYVRGESADARSDIFALGCVLYEMATGYPAFDGNSPAEKLASILRDEPSGIRLRDPDLPVELDRVIEHCLEKDPDR